MTITTKMHTIFLLVGPTECGKSTFAKEVLLPQLRFSDKEKGFQSNVQYISSDALRQELLGHPYDKYDQVMTEASVQAFEMLFTKLKAVTTFPIKAEFVILDTTGLSEDFRNQVLEIAKTNHYNVEVVLFDYKNVKDYYSSERSKKLIASHVNRIRRDVLPTLKRNRYANVHRIKAKDFPEVYNFLGYMGDYNVVISDKTEYLQHILPTQYSYVVIGDVHEKVEELTSFLNQNGFPIVNGQIQETEKNKHQRLILIGDWIDKGGATKEIIDFLHENVSWFYFVKGNHENYVAKYLNGELETDQINSNLIENYFDSIPFLEKKSQKGFWSETTKKFMYLVSSSKNFYRYIGLGKSSFYVTHAPCENKFLGKLDSFSQKNQRRFATNHDQPLEEQLSFLKKEAVSNHPFHIFGHVAVKEAFRVKNKIGIDTGIVYGNALTGVSVDNGRIFFKSWTSKDSIQQKTDMPIVFPREVAKVNIDELSESDRKRLNYVLRNKINFISGTMSPSDKDLENNELESLSKGLSYFKDKGVKQVILQPKYMGSRCNLYLSLKTEESFATTRNGYKIEHVDLTSVFVSLQNKFQSYMQENDLKMMVLDGELLPWSTLGKGLIQKEFSVVEKSLDTEISFLKTFGFESSLKEMTKRLDESDYEYDQVKGSKKSLIERYGHSQHTTFKNLLEYLPTHMPLSKHEEAHGIFKEQLAIYGQEGEMDYKPFAILKTIKNNDEEYFPSLTNEEMFRLISDDDFIVLDLVKEENVEEKAQYFFDELTTQRKMEGVVIKPNIPTEGVALYMKVRNPQYLTIVYGYDYKFPYKYSKLLKQKNINRKLRTSIAEYKLGMDMLRVPLKEIDSSNNTYKKLVCDMLFEASKESTIDPRL